MNERPRRSNLWRLIGSIIILLVAVLVFFFRQQLVDQYSVWKFRPSSEISALADATTMTEHGRFYLYASTPEINDRETFNSHCTQRGEKAAILGCYVANRIYIFDVNDPRLDGIKEVTTAHEMLHAAYQRLSEGEKARINGLVEKQLAGITDSRIKDLVALYDRSEPGERANELHSILGTEIDKLDPELETYYQRYFKDRQAIVAMSKRYEAVFAEISAEQTRLVAELNKLAGEITAESEAYNKSTSQLNKDISMFNQKANSGGFSSQEQFNAERSVLMARQTAIQSVRTELNAMIESYNQKRQRLEALNGQAEALNRSINSQLTPVPSL